MISETLRDTLSETIEDLSASVTFSIGCHAVSIGSKILDWARTWGRELILVILEESVRKSSLEGRRQILKYLDHEIRDALLASLLEEGDTIFKRDEIQ